MNRQLGSSFSARERLLERPWIAALLARWAPPAVAVTTQYLVLTRPVGQSVRIDVSRTDGVIAYTGSAEPTGNELALSITDVDHPQTVHTILSGTLEADAQFEAGREHVCPPDSSSPSWWWRSSSPS